MSNNINISSVVSPDILKTISSATAIKTLGDQLKDKAKEKVISVVKGKVGELTKEINGIIALKIKVESDHGTELKRLDVLLKENQIIQRTYDLAVEKENIAYNKKLKDLEKLQLKLEEDLRNIIADPFYKIKENKNKRKLARAKRKSRSKAERVKARRDLTKKVIKNAAKTLVPVIALQLTNKFASVLSQRAKLEQLVDQVNAYIDQANTPDTIQIATNLRNNTISLINNSIKKLQNIQDIIKKLDIYISIFTAVVAILSAIPIPTAVPPGVGIPVSLIMRIVKALDKASKLIISLNVISVIAITILENEIIKLNELILKLKPIDNKATDLLDSQQLSDLSNSIVGSNNQFPSYKGFNFKIKEEQNQAFVVKGNKRHYAVAIDRYNVEIVKSDYSFTQDPNDLIEQLKLTIDQQNLQG
jgi:hypothetical protein